MWFDATQDDAADAPAWKDLADAKALQPALIHSVGFLIAQHPDRVILAQSVAEDTQTQGRFMIPTSFVRSITKVR